MGVVFRINGDRCRLYRPHSTVAVKGRRVVDAYAARRQMVKFLAVDRIDETFAVARRLGLLIFTMVLTAPPDRCKDRKNDGRR